VFLSKLFPFAEQEEVVQGLKDINRYAVKAGSIGTHNTVKFHQFQQTQKM
jgi:hypothetical protein